MNAQLRLRKILLADDGSEHARAAVALLGDLPLPPEHKVAVLRVFTPLQSAEHAVIETALGQTCALLQEKNLHPEPEMLLGYPAEKIVEYAEQNKPDLIVLGAKGLRATLGILLGGVAQQVVEYVCCPVLIVRSPYKGLRRVLLVTDGSAHSQRAVEYLRQFPLPAGAEVQVMHVLPPPPFPIIVAEPGYTGPPLIQPLPITEETAALRAKEEKEGKRLLNRTVKMLSASGIRATSVLHRGDAATEIIEYVKAHKIDLIVAGSRGLSRIRSWLMGSVSRKLVHYSGCSVLVVRGPKGE